MRSEDVATVGMRVIETIEKSVAEEVKNSLLFTQLIEVTNRYRKAIGPNDKEEKAAIKEKFQFRKQLFNNFYNFVLFNFSAILFFSHIKLIATAGINLDLARSGVCSFHSY